MNAIYTNQSTRENLDLLYAQARVYDRVKLEQTEFSLQHHRTAPAFVRYRIQPEPGICRFRAVVFVVGVIWTPGAYL